MVSPLWVTLYLLNANLEGTGVGGASVADVVNGFALRTGGCAVVVAGYNHNIATGFVGAAAVERHIKVVVAVYDKQSRIAGIFSGGSGGGKFFITQQRHQVFVAVAQIQFKPDTGIGYIRFRYFGTTADYHQQQYYNSSFHFGVFVMV
jgi:hypothetical protein